MKKNAKRFLSILSCFLITAGMEMQAYATEGFAGEYYRLIDMAGILSEQEDADILAELDEISERQEMEVAIITVDNLDVYDDIQEYADDLYEYCEFGYGEDRDGMVLVISMEGRDWCISTCGYGITVLTDAGIEYIGDLMKDDLSEENYADAFYTYAECCDQMITQAREGHPFDRSDLPKKPMSAMTLPIVFLIAVALAVVIVKIMKGQLKSVHNQAEAGDYVRAESMNISESRDLFLYRTVQRTKREEKKESGSSTHESSSGTKHGGGGGKF